MRKLVRAVVWLVTNRQRVYTIIGEIRDIVDTWDGAGQEDLAQDEKSMQSEGPSIPTDEPAMSGEYRKALLMQRVLLSNLIEGIDIKLHAQATGGH